MSDAPRLSADISIWVCDLTEHDLDEIRDRIDEAIAAYEPTVTVTTHEHPAA